MSAPRDEPSVRVLAEKLLELAEAQAETQLEDTRSRQRFRRELAEQLSNIETTLARMRSANRREDDPAILTRSEIWPMIKGAAPFVVAAITALSGWVFHLLHNVR